MTERGQGREQDAVKKELHSETIVRAEPIQLGRLSSSQSHLPAPAQPLCLMWKPVHKSYALKRVYSLLRFEKQPCSMKGLPHKEDSYFIEQRIQSHGTKQDQSDKQLEIE